MPAWYSLQELRNYLELAKTSTQRLKSLAGELTAEVSRYRV